MHYGDKTQEAGFSRRDLITATAAGLLATGSAQAQQPAPAARPAAAGRVAYRAISADTIQLRGHQGDTIDAYLARPAGAGRYPGVVVIHHMPGWDEATMEIARKFAHHGYAAICPNLHFREGKATPEENSASIRAAGGMPDDRTMGDVDGAIRHLRTLRYVNGKVGIIGYCSGGRQVYLAACTLKGINAAVACYPGGVGAGAAGLTPRQPVDPVDYTKDLSCPLLGLFGKEDKRPAPEHVAKIEAELKKSGKVYELHSFDNTGHSFFATDRPDYRPASASEGWKHVFAWYEKHLS
ncbi:MAG: dienelactone hydrolase family protein [Candidatus Solibacter sp.]|nr:dienelactone hydrolase family protein [Candidatus Solibacter sp.]